METLPEIKKESALKAYNEADASGKKLLENLYGKEMFNQKITDRVKTFADACAIAGMDAQAFLKKCQDSELSEDEVAYRQLKIITAVLNEGKVPDWNNSSKPKWFPVFKWNGSGFRFSYSDYACTGTHTGVGSRLCFETEALSQYAGKQFESIYAKFYNP